MELTKEVDITMARAGGKNNSLKQPKEEINVKYMHKPPRIQPNYGPQAKRSLLPKSKVSRVLLYDNATQDHMLDIKLAHINIEKERITRIINLHKRSFCIRQTKRQNMMQASMTGSKSHNNGAHSAIHSGTAVDHQNGNKIAATSKFAYNNQGSKSSGKPSTKTGSDNKLKRVNMDAVKFPIIDNDERHVIFKLEDTKGNTEVFHTIDEDGMIGELLPIHQFYDKLTDDPRFKLLHSSLVPLD